MKSVTTKRRSSKKSATKKPLPRIARAPKPKKASSAVSEQATAPTPHVLDASAPPFYLGDVNPEASTLRLVRAMFDAPNATGMKDPTAAFLADVLLCNADDVHLANYVNDELDHGPIVDRVLHRIKYRASLAIEIARRAEKGGAS